MIYDVHTHHPAPQPEGIISVDAETWSPIEDQFYSVGLHPWRADITSVSLDMLRQAACHPAVVAIGECGLDASRGAPMYSQIMTFKECIKIACEVGKAMIVHDVKSHSQLITMHKEYSSNLAWAIHGFRGKPSVAKILIDAGFYISFGAKFNPLALSIVPQNRILAETDEAETSIESVMDALAKVRTDVDNMRELVAENTHRFLNHSKL